METYLEEVSNTKPPRYREPNYNKWKEESSYQINMRDWNIY